MSAVLQAEVAIVGGGIAGLWTLARLRQSGIDAVLLEGQALGSGQTIQAQGIVHGGGKYALRSVGDRAAIEAIREMPQRWREHFASDRLPSLKAATLLSTQCWLWLPQGQWRARIESWGLMPMLRHGGVLHCPPRAVPQDQWPVALKASALRAYSMAEPVFSTESVQQALTEDLAEHLFRFDATNSATELSIDELGRWHSMRVFAGEEELEVRASMFVLTAGSGNAEWIERGGGRSDLMQRRPLLMFLLRGDLPELHGHCFLGGKTRMTITSHDLPGERRVWQLGGEVAERHAETDDLEAAYADCRRELAVVLPALDLGGLEMSCYRAVRAERRRPDHRRPGGVQVESVAPNAWVGWPTKWALAPVLADEIHREVTSCVLQEGSKLAPVRARWPRPQVARTPWEEDLTWRDVVSATVA